MNPFQIFWSASEFFFNPQEYFRHFVSHESLLECIIINSQVFGPRLFFFELKASYPCVQMEEKEKVIFDQKYFSHSQTDIDLNLGWK